MRKLQVDQEPGLACWASYLINGDASGISPEDRADADAFAEFCGGAVVSTADEESWIGRYYGPGSACGLQCEMITYVIHRWEGGDSA